MLNQDNLQEVYTKIFQLIQRKEYAAAESMCLFVMTNAASHDAQLLFYLGAAKQLQGQTIAALDIFNKARELDPQNLNLINASASCLSQLNRHQEVLALLQSSLSFTPNDAELNANVAVSFENLGRVEEALRHYDLALSLNPLNAIALINRGSLLGRIGRRAEWLKHNQNAYKIAPNIFAHIFNLVDALIGTFNYEEALHFCDLGLAGSPRDASLLFKKGIVLSCLRHFKEAQRYLSEAQVIHPNIVIELLPGYKKMSQQISVYVDAKVIYFDAMYQEQVYCYWPRRDKFIEILSKALCSPEDNYFLVNNPEFGFNSFSLELDAKTRLKLAQNIGDQVRDMAWVKGSAPYQFKKHGHARIKIAYISPDFKKHATGHLSCQIYGLHNREKFEVFGYSLFPPDITDEVYQQIKSGCDVFREVASLDTITIANMLYADEIDILIDLAGYTRDARPDVISMRSVPIQVSYMGYMESMGGGLVDYVMTDINIYPSNAKSYWHEAAIRLPHHVLPYDNKVNNDLLNASRADYGLPEHAFIFCCLNNANKIEPKVFNSWANILKAIPDSVMWLLETTQETKSNLQREAHSRGIASERLIFTTRMPYEQHILRYQLADIFLDTLWHNAHTTALEALWQGLPLLTLEGNVVSARVAASCLTVLGLPELITHDLNTYEKKAIYYAQNPEELLTLRKRLKAARYTSPLFDSELTVRHLESAYQKIWQRYQADLPAIDIDVPDR